jgi:hypothetical protein
MAFQKGNTLARKFNPSRSDNPEGDLKESVSKVLRELLSTEIESKSGISKTEAELIAVALIRAARQGKVQAAARIADRTEGKVPQTLGESSNSHRRYRFNGWTGNLAAPAQHAMNIAG